MRSGLDVIGSRAESLTRFMQAYSKFARLPAPLKAPCPIADLVMKVVPLERRAPVTVLDGPQVTVECDAAQVEQVLINLLKNAVEAILETGGGVRVGWRKRDGYVQVRVEDDGPGLANPGNLFVPFFTTKPDGTGIGLVLCRQIAENHGGSLTLENRTDASGCLATLCLPMQQD